ncbi:hypothetical protein [Nocardia carnea]|uniref:Uncharacterized protein n=1 Tax=Nocardia carnea TaxID=37328 RepID=A0ABW7TQ77_9NOCA|nr:hypothetical protein [Nocardia carnea]
MDSTMAVALSGRFGGAGIGGSGATSPTGSAALSGTGALGPLAVPVSGRFHADSVAPGPQNRHRTVEFVVW